jgi:hypothetical protein
MAALTPKVFGGRVGVSIADADLAAATVTVGDTFPAGPATYFLVQNKGASAVTVTIKGVAGGGPLGTTIADQALSPVTEITTGLRIYGPFPSYPYADSSGNVTAVCSSVTTVKVAALVMAG